MGKSIKKDRYQFEEDYYYPSESDDKKCKVCGRPEKDHNKKQRNICWNQRRIKEQPAFYGE